MKLRPWHRYYLHAVPAVDEGEGLADVINNRPQGFILRRSAVKAAYFYENRLKFKLLVHLYIRPKSDRAWTDANS
jgi:hypothetical protein